MQHLGFSEWSHTIGNLALLPSTIRLIADAGERDYAVSLCHTLDHRLRDSGDGVSEYTAELTRQVHSATVMVPVGDELFNNAHEAVVTLAQRFLFGAWGVIDAAGFSSLLVSGNVGEFPGGLAIEKWDSLIRYLRQSKELGENEAHRLVKLVENERIHFQSVKGARLVVDIKCGSVTYDGRAYDISSVNALRWLKILAEHPGEWISGGDLERYDPELMSVRTSELRSFLPADILKLVESVTGKGSRLRLSTV